MKIQTAVTWEFRYEISFPETNAKQHNSGMKSYILVFGWPVP